MACCSPQCTPCQPPPFHRGMYWNVAYLNRDNHHLPCLAVFTFFLERQKQVNLPVGRRERDVDQHISYPATPRNFGTAAAPPPNHANFAAAAAAPTASPTCPPNAFSASAAGSPPFHYQQGTPIYNMSAGPKRPPPPVDTASPPRAGKGRPSPTSYEDRNVKQL